jgi:hypothetical protein
MSFVLSTVRPKKQTLTMRLIILPLPVIMSAVVPGTVTYTAHQVVFKITNEFEIILLHKCAFTVLLAFFVFSREN